MAILKRLLGLKRETSAKEKKKVYKGRKRTRTVTKGRDASGKKYKTTVVTGPDGKVIKKKRVEKGQGKGMLASGKKMLLGRYKTKSKNKPGRPRKWTEKGTQFKVNKKGRMSSRGKRL